MKIVTMDINGVAVEVRNRSQSNSENTNMKFRFNHRKLQFFLCDSIDMSYFISSLAARSFCLMALNIFIESANCYMNFCGI